MTTSCHTNISCTWRSLIVIAIVPVLSGAKSASLKNESSPYAKMISTPDFYAPPAKTNRVLSLSEVFKLVRKQGTEMKVANETLNQARQVARQQNEKLIPQLLFSSNATKGQNTSAADPETGTQASKTETVNGGSDFTLSGAPVQGVSYSLSLPQFKRNLQSKEDTKNSNATYGYDFSLSVALLKDNPITTESLLQRKSDIDLQRATVQFKADSVKALSAAQKSFFSLIQKNLQMIIQRRSLELAKALESEVKEKIAAGESGKTEAVSASLQTAQSETEMMSVEMDFETAIEEFRATLSLPENSTEIVFPDPKSIDIDVESWAKQLPTVDVVKKFNSELMISRLDAEKASIELSLARNNALPQLDFGSSIKNERQNPEDNSALAGFASSEDRTISFSLGLKWILFNDPASRAKQTAAIVKQKADASVMQLSRSVEKTFNSLRKRADIGRKKLSIAKTSREIAEQKLTTEYLKFQVGESSIKNVIDSQTALNQARLTEIGAKIDLLNGFGELRALAGQFFEDDKSGTSNTKGGVN